VYANSKNVVPLPRELARARPSDNPSEGLPASAAGATRSSVLKEQNGHVTFKVRVVPRASKNQIVGVEGDAVKIRLAAPPVEGKANEALVKFLAALLDLPRSSIEIVAGQSSRNKVIRIRGVGVKQVERAVLKRES
jgi:uncharacterized protein (TIGR00251 family)